MLKTKERRILKIEELKSIKTIPVDISDSLQKLRENQSFHTPYKDEIRLLSCIKHGDISKLFEELGNLMKDGIFVGQMSKNNLQQKKYMAVSCITLATRYAIQGGLNESEAYRFSDVTICEIDSINDEDQVIGHLAIKIAELTKAVKDNSEKMLYSPHVRKCMAYINKNLNKKIKIKDIADECGLSCDYISQIFKKEVGETISSFIIRQKLETAESLLFNGVDNNKISYMLGFCSQSHFISSFKKYYGKTPKEYMLDMK